MDLLFQCVVGWTVEVYMLFLGTKSLELHVKLVYRLIVGFLGWFGWFDCGQLTLLIFFTWFVFCLFFLLFDFYSSSIFVFFFRFCGYIFCKPSWDLTRPLAGTKWFKGLVAYAKCNRDSYDSELDFKILFFALLEDEQSLSMGVFVWVLT